MKYFSKPGVLLPFAFELDGSQDHLITPDMVSCPEPLPQSLSFAEYKAREMAAFRAMRLDLLDVLTGIGFRATVLAQPDVAVSAATFQQALLDLPGLPSITAAQTPAELKAALKAAYNAATAGAHPVVLTEWQKVKP